MVINKNSWHYKVWSFTNSLWDDRRFIPDTVNLCTYTRQIAFTPFNMILWLLAVSIFGMGAAVCLTMQIVWGLLIGYLPTNLKFDQRPYNGLRIGRMEIFPVHVLLVALLLLLVKTFTSMHLAILVGLGMLVGVVVLMMFIAKWWDSDSTGLVKSWFSARKQGVCPTITFEDK